MPSQPSSVSPKFRYTSAPQRREAIMEQLSQKGFCTVHELAELFDVSEMTIRRDVARLTDDQPWLRSVYGGLSVTPISDAVGTDYDLRRRENFQQKRIIGAAATDYLVNGETVFIDSGTTLEEMARQIPETFMGRIVTNSVPAAHILSQRHDIELFVLGGRVLHPTHAIGGGDILKSLSLFSIDTYFLSASAITDGKIWCSNAEESRLKAELVKIAKRVIAVSDRSKFSKRVSSSVCDVSDVHLLITDGPIPAEEMEFFENIEVRTV